MVRLEHAPMTSASLKVPVLMPNAPLRRAPLAAAAVAVARRLRMSGLWA